ncbi:unnamed protein product [Menidia menidia]|uniref:(Atlantic silverside) hypothetical protein n=1 Tax=Menidia menidia TaxID=238744 RepID=A0A8S4ANZ2_9TELE|nr:unnamed protein product [Menidia menidia]
MTQTGRDSPISALDGTMENIFQCFNRLLNFFNCQDALDQSGADRSGLLSSEESDCDSPNLRHSLEDDLLTVSTGISNPALEPEHFLYPDIILSSNPGGEVTLVEPMVCLLVSEEEEGMLIDVEGPDRDSREGRESSFSEAETQTDTERQIGMGVQTQTESQAEVQTEAMTPTIYNETVDTEGHTLTNTVYCDAKPEEVDLEIMGTQKKGKERTGSGDSPDVKASSEEGEFFERMGEKFTELQKQSMTVEEDSFKLQQSITADQVNPKHNMNEDSPAKPSSHYTGIAQNFEPVECCEEQNVQSNDSGAQKAEASVLPGTVGGKDLQDIHSDETTGGSIGNFDHIMCQEDLCQPKREENDITSGLQHFSAALTAVESDEGAEAKQMTMFLVDRLFLEAPHFTAASENHKDDLEEEPEDEKRNQLSLQDMADLKETDFTIRIQSPGTESFELQVSERMLVAELHQVLMDHEITCHRTCFSLQLGGVALDNLAELRSIPGMQDGALIKVVEDSYSVRDVRLHLRHVRDLLRSLDPTDSYNGVNGSSLSYLSSFTRRDGDCENVGKRRTSEKVSVDCSPPAYILPGCKERPLIPLHPVKGDWKSLQCLRVLTMSSWNPPPGNRKMHGDLMYIHVLTMEDKELNITSSTRGFYLNQSTAFNFSPKPTVPKILCHSLVELLSQFSPVFKKNFSALQRRRVQQHPYERMAAPFPVFSWIAPHGDHSLDCVRAEETHTSRMGQDEHTAGQSRDWNEELQGCRELPSNSLQERLHRERSLFKTNSNFVAAAAQGAVAVIDGDVMPLNPGESAHLQMFVWNNLFFSQGFDMSEHYRPLGGNSAAHAAPLCDLRGAQAYASVDTEGLHTLGTAVVDYRGIRVVAQTIVPGILEKNHEQIVYGSNDNGKTVFTHPRFLELLDKTSKPLRIQHHQVLDHNDKPVQLCSGLSTVGILGNDGRPYILDLLRTFPPDLNFQFSDTEIMEKVPKECQSLGYPRLHPHCLANLRRELIEAFVQHRYELFVKMVSQELSEIGKQDETKEQSEGPEHGPAGTDDAELQRKNVIMKACKAVGSISDSCFDIRFNPDICSPGVRFPSGCDEELQSHIQLIWDAAAFLLSNQIPAALQDCLEHTAVPMDGATLTSVLHQRGVNVRYLGTIMQKLEEMEERVRLSHIQRISMSEIIIRSTKHIFRTYLQNVEPAAFSAAVSHFLNCLLGSSVCLPDSGSDELLSRRRSRRRRSHGGRAGSLPDGVWVKLSAAELWSRIRAEAEDYYHYTVNSESLDELIQKHNLQRISLLRELAIKTGIQVQLREYVFDSRHRPVFGEDDIINMFPVFKHLRPTSADATRLVQQAQLAVQQGLLRDGHELIGQALTLFSSVCGILHEDVCTCLRLLGRLSYVLGENADALSYQEKAVMGSERVQGVDHPQTIQDYIFLALYCFAGGCHSTALQLLYRARYLTLLVSGDDHPQVALLDSMLGLLLYGLMEYELSIKYLQNALNMTSKYHGERSMNHAQSHHLLAIVDESKGEFRSALQHEKEAYSIYKSQVGENHERTKQSSEYLKHLTQQAVILQKAINHLYNDRASACTAAPKFSTPNLPDILHQLNLTCGIILIPLSAKEFADLRNELRGKEKVTVEELEKQLLRQKGPKNDNDR